MEQTNSHKREILTVLAVLIVIAVIVGGVIVSSKKKSDDTTTTSTSTTSKSTASDTPATTTTPSTSTDTAGGYKDGTYTAEGGYNSPGGFQTITVKVTVASSNVTDAEVTTNPTDREAAEYQEKFEAGYKAQVVGKSLDSIKLSRVSGSSLTSQGFNNALEQIKQQAQS